MVSNNRLFEVVGRLRSGVRSEIKRLRNPRHLKGSERDILFTELPQNPLRIVEFAARVAVRKHGWDGVRWGIDDEGCWIMSPEGNDDVNYFVMIDRAEGNHESEILAALDLLAKVTNDRNN
jgi:hypothetical protein